MPTYDVAIIGAGPGGTTVASFLKKFMPQLDVCIIEKETPRAYNTSSATNMGLPDHDKEGGFL